MPTPDVKIIISAVDKFSKQMRGPLRKVDQLGKSFTNAGRKLTMGVTVPVAAAGFKILKTAGNFELAMNRVQNLTGASAQEFKALQKQARDLGATTVFSAGQAADAMGFLGMAGFSTRQIMDALPSTLNLAAAAQMDLGQTADIVSNILTGYNKDAAETTTVSDVLVKTFQSTNTNLEQLGEAMSYVAPMAASLKVPFNQASVAIGMLSNAGIQGARAGTNLRAILGALAKPTNQAVNVLAKLKIKKSDILDASGNITDLRKVIEAFSKSGATAADLATIFGIKMGPGMAALISQGIGKFDDLTVAIDNSAGAAKAAADVQSKGLFGTLKMLNSATEELSIAIAESGLIQFVTRVSGKLAEIVRELAKTNPKLLKFGTIVVMVAAVIGPLLLLLGTLLTSVAGIGLFWVTWGPTIIPVLVGILGALLPLIVPILAIAAALGIWIHNINYLAENWADVLDGMKIVFGAWWKTILKYISAFASAVVPMIAPVLALFEQIVSHWGTIKNFGGAVGEKIKGIFGFGDNTDTTGKTAATENTLDTADALRGATNKSEFSGKMIFENTPAKSKVIIEKNDGLNLEVNSGKLQPGT